MTLLKMKINIYIYIKAIILGSLISFSKDAESPETREQLGRGTTEI